MTTHRITSGRPPAFSAENLADNPTVVKNTSRKKFVSSRGELNRRAAELMEQGHHDGDQHPADHGDRYIETREQGNATGDCGRNHEREQSHGKGLKIGQRNHHCAPSTAKRGPRPGN